MNGSECHETNWKYLASPHGGPLGSMPNFDHGARMGPLGPALGPFPSDSPKYLGFGSLVYLAEVGGKSGANVVHATSNKQQTIPCFDLQQHQGKL